MKHEKIYVYLCIYLFYGAVRFGINFLKKHRKFLYTVEQNKSIKASTMIRRILMIFLNHRWN